MSRDRTWTILDVLKWTTSFFESHGVESPRISSELLLAHVLCAKRLDLYLRYDQPLSSDELARFRKLVLRRRNHEPVAYITGTKEFWGMEIEVTPDVLIPRPDTERLVETALFFLEKECCSNIYEPATGSGAVILAIAANVSAPCRFFASDRFPSALEVARRNAVRHNLVDMVSFFASDWFSALTPSHGLFFDMIVANPPYIASDDIERLDPQVSVFEPRHAIDGGPDGLDHVRCVVRDAWPFLKPGGVLLLEIGWDQKEDVYNIAKNIGGYSEIGFEKDLAGHNRVAHMRKCS